MTSVENVQCRKCVLQKMRVWKMRSVENVECRIMRSVKSA